MCVCLQSYLCASLSLFLSRKVICIYTYIYIYTYVYIYTYIHRHYCFFAPHGRLQLKQSGALGRDSPHIIRAGLLQGTNVQSDDLPDFQRTSKLRFCLGCVCVSVCLCVCVCACSLLSKGLLETDARAGISQRHVCICIYAYQ